jgi:methylmalonyl-CoA mutase C-terminal domain/subunit
MSKRIRVLLAKVGLDCHTRGINVISTALRDSGMEVIYLGPFQTPAGIVKAAIEEDVDVIGVSSLSGGHMLPFSEICQLLKEKGISNILFVGGGFITKDEADILRERGISRIFGPGTTTNSVVKYIQECCE